jgi:hypothetical protein
MKEAIVACWMILSHSIHTGLKILTHAIQVAGASLTFKFFTSLHPGCTDIFCYLLRDVSTYRLKKHVCC